MSTKSKGNKHKGKDAGDGVQVIVQNRKVRHDYEILKTFEAGLVLVGTEVKALRDRDVQWADAHVRLDHQGEAWVWGLYIAPYRMAAQLNHKPAVPRKLLLHKKELVQLERELSVKGVTCVPRQLHFRRGRAKVDICVVRGKKQHDKRQDLINRTKDREVQREIASRMRR